MKPTCILTITVAIAALAIPASSLAAKAKGKAAKDPLRQAVSGVLSLYDKDSSRAINGDEIAEVRKAFDAEKTGPLKPLDLNADGTLDDNEIAAIQKAKGKGKGKGKKGRKAAEPAPAAPAPAAPTPAEPAPSPAPAANP